MKPRSSKSILKLTWLAGIEGYPKHPTRQRKTQLLWWAFLQPSNFQDRLSTMANSKHRHCACQARCSTSLEIWGWTRVSIWFQVWSMQEAIGKSNHCWSNLIIQNAVSSRAQSLIYDYIREWDVSPCEQQHPVRSKTMTLPLNSITSYRAEYLKKCNTCPSIKKNKREPDKPTIAWAPGTLESNYRADFK